MDNNGNNSYYNLPFTNNCNIQPYPYSTTNTNRITYFGNELSEYELMNSLLVEFNNLILNVSTTLANFQSQLNLKEFTTDITNKRKLSADGDFTGTLCNKKMTACEAVANITNNRDKIKWMLDQFIDGQNGIVIDGGFFTESRIKWNFDGGAF